MGVYRPETKHRYKTSLYDLLDELGSAAGTRDSEVITSLLIHLLASGRGRMTRLSEVGGSSCIAGIRPARMASAKDIAV